MLCEQVPPFLWQLYCLSLEFLITALYLQTFLVKNRNSSYRVTKHKIALINLLIYISADYRHMFNVEYHMGGICGIGDDNDSRSQVLAVVTRFEYYL